MDILPFRDLIQDGLGNYYEIVSVEGDELTIVNFILYRTFTRIVKEDFIKDFEKYENTVYVGQLFMDMLNSKINGIKEGKFPGNIFLLEDILKKYNVSNLPLYEKQASITSN
ncbi:hypothetical protein OQ477_00730 [Bacillus sp. ChL18]|uniref:hypothetical protein n=1 Tax=Bacillus TaxID=1386 RepID=UPI002248950F|nr:hypothetical protein [Bacillus sp. ChL18]MCX2808525.1 hypothetical protein [Bacillus sp. ChL18]